MGKLPDPALVVLVGPSGAGKSTWADHLYRPEEIVSSDRLRAVVGSGEHDLDASAVAFELLDQIVRARLGRRLTAVVDTLGFDAERRRAHREAARQAGLPAVAVLFDTPEILCRERNRLRDRPVPAAVLTAQFRRLRQVRHEIGGEGWDLVVPVHEALTSPVPTFPAQAEQQAPETGVGLYLQVSRWPSQASLGPWLREMGVAAESAGFRGLAVMDHLVQIPQVGREWDNMIEAYTALAYVAASTSKLELGALVTNSTLRNPALLAKTLASLDALSGGRAFCGLGAGWFDAEQRAYGYERLSARNRLDILEDTVRILRLMWGPGKASYQGKVHSVGEAVCYPRPSHPIPIYIGGKGKRTVALAANLADGLNLIGSGRLAEVMPAITGRLEDGSRFQLSILDLPLIGRERAEVAALIEKWRGRMRAETFAVRHHPGTAVRHLERYRDLAGLGLNAIFVSPVGLSQPGELAEWSSITEALRGLTNARS